MSRVAISRLARMELYKRLADPLIGLNPLLQAATSEFGLKYFSDGKMKLPIDFDLTTTRHLIFGSTSPLLQEGTTSFKYPYICLYNHGAVNENLQKFVKFAGKIVMGLDVWLSWVPSNGLTDFEIYGDIVEESIVEIVNGFGSDNGAITQNWGPNLVYNGGVSCSRTELQMAAQNWLQGLKFRVTFQAVI